MIEVAGEPFIRHQLRSLYERGVDDVVICVAHRGEIIEDEVTRHHPDGMTVRCSRDASRFLGTGGALSRAVADGRTDEQFMVLSDLTYPSDDFVEMWEWFDVEHHLGLMAVWHNDEQLETSNAAVRNGRVVGYRAASIRSAHPSMTYIGCGLGILTADSVLELGPAEEPSDIALLYSTIAGRGLLQAYELDEPFYEIRSESGLAEFTRRLTSELQRSR